MMMTATFPSTKAGLHITHSSSEVCSLDSVQQQVHACYGYLPVSIYTIPLSTLEQRMSTNPCSRFQTLREANAYSPLLLFFKNACSPPSFSSISSACFLAWALVLGLEMVAL